MSRTASVAILAQESPGSHRPRPPSVGSPSPDFGTRLKESSGLRGREFTDGAAAKPLSPLAHAAMPLTQEDLQALQGMMASQLGPIQSGLQSLQDSVGAQFQAVNQQLTTLTREQERLAREQMKQAEEAEVKFAKIREEMAGVSAFGSAFGAASGTTSPPRKQSKREEDEAMPEAAPTGGGAGTTGDGLQKPATRRVASQPPPRSTGKDGTQTRPNPIVLWIKGFGGPRTQTFLSREASSFLISLGVGTGVIDPRSRQQAVKVTFTMAQVADEALGKFRAVQSKGMLRLVPDKNKLARTRDGLTGWWAECGKRSRVRCVVRSSPAK